jgi:hypothetical protein
MYKSAQVCTKFDITHREVVVPALSQHQDLLTHNSATAVNTGLVQAA